jgi:hypothetical protein
MSDPLFRDVTLEESSTHPVLGIPVRFESNSPTVLVAVQESFGGTGSRTAAVDEAAGSLGLAVRVVVHPGEEGGGDHPPLTTRIPDRERLLLSTPGSMAIADVTRRDAVAYVTPALLADREHFRYGVLEALTLFLVTHFDRQPVHAAGVVRGDRGLLLAGPSGVGKSSLAYAAMRSGFRVLTDDAVYVQRDPRLRVWGMPRYLHLPPSSRTFFPELSHALPTARATGKLKMAVDLRTPERIVTPPVVERIALCILARGTEATRLTRVSPQAATEDLREASEPGFDLFADTLEACGAELAQRGCWRLTMADPPQVLIPYLNEMLSGVDAVR